MFSHLYIFNVLKPNSVIKLHVLDKTLGLKTRTNSAKYFRDGYSPLYYRHEQFAIKYLETSTETVIYILFKKIKFNMRKTL